LDKRRGKMIDLMKIKELSVKVRKTFWIYYPELQKTESFYKRIQNPENTVDLITPLKLMDLHFLLKTIQPKSILELGPGWTTFVFLKYKKRNPKATITSIEESEAWKANLSKGLKKAGYDHKIIISEKMHDDKACYYNDLPIPLEGGYDFVYVDGPANTIDGKELICTDAITAISVFEPEYVFFDWRNSSFLNTAEYASKNDKYEVFPGITCGANSDHYHNYLKKKKNKNENEVAKKPI
jgi:hypothetical protein